MMILTGWVFSVFATLLMHLPFDCNSFALYPALGSLRRTETNTNIYENDLGSPSWKRRNRFDTTKVAVVGAGGSGVELNSDFGFGEVASAVLLIGFSAAVGAFIFANQAYTPEIIQGAQMLRKTNRENEIRKLLEAVRSHQEDGKELLALRLPMEAALGMTLEEYIRAVERGLEENSDTIFTTADEDL
eukprot:CAMPEP_0172372294 /NCGR_PEP_ID=MMETSP1060-20121228/46880_1 /TAXON_ID=37318 /ORGANISM="Pseudo-nitzschia pungens, Strain cf. cingulata" /LENGTH=187 /DNA_ID=CAMNT_0013098217 /DNA_START=82 /DNA_END=642 /DNA_ORIENTATION=-